MVVVIHSIRLAPFSGTDESPIHGGDPLVRDEIIQERARRKSYRLVTSAGPPDDRATMGTHTQTKQSITTKVHNKIAITYCTPSVG